MVAGTFKNIRVLMSATVSRYEQDARRARENPTLARAGSLVAGVFVMLGILDVISTNWALEVGAYEANAFIRYLQEKFGTLWFVPKIMLQALVATMIVWSPNKPTLIIMILSCCWTASVVSSNFMIAALLT